MFSKKTRNLTVAVLAVIMALTLTFGLVGFNTQVNAEIATDEVTFNSSNGFAAMSSGGTVTKDLTNGNKYKLLASNSVALGSSANKTGYRVDGGRLAVVFEFKYATNLTIYHNANSTGGRYVQLSSFESTKELKDIVAGDYSAKTAVAFTSVAGTTLGSGVQGTPTPSSDKTTYSYSKKGCLVITYTGLSAGKYVLIGTGSESYLYGFKLEYDVPPAVTYTYTVDSVVAPTGNEMYVGDGLNTAGLPTTVTGNFTKTGSDGSSETGTVNVPVTGWAFAAGNDATTAGEKAVVGTLGTVDGYTMNVTTVEAKVNVKEDTRKTVASLNEINTVGIDLSETYTFPTTLEGLDTNGAPITANVVWANANGETVTEFNPTAKGDNVFTATVTTGDYLYTGSITQTLTITVTDKRPTVTGLTGYTKIVTASEASLPTTLEGNLSDGTKTQVNVTWDKDLVTTAPSTTTYTATAAVGNAYQLDATVTAEVTLKIKPVYASTFSALWDITQENDDVTWNGEKSLSVGIKSEHTLVKAQGITINAAVGTVADTKWDTDNSPLGNCVKANKNTDLLVITVPAGMSGKIKVRASNYRDSQTPSLKLNGGTAITPSTGKYGVTHTVNGTETLYTSDTDIISHQYMFEFDFNNNTNESAKYTITNASGNIYTSSVEVSGQLPSSKHYFFAGETFGTLEVPGYTFIGWTSADAADTTLHTATETAPADGDYYAIAAKLEYLGVSFRLNVDFPGVRYGFILKFYDLSDDPNSPNSLKQENLTALNIDVTHITFNVTRGDGKKATVEFDDTTLASEYSEKYMGYISNLVIMGITAADCNQIMKVDATFAITVGANTFNRSVEGVAANISEKATEAYNQGDFGVKGTDGAKALAAKYGVTVA